MEIDNYKIKLTGTANIDQELDNSATYDLTISNAEVRKKAFDPNDNGTENLTHTITISEISEINLIGKGELIKAKKKGSQAKVLRFILMEEADMLGMDREQHYQDEMNLFINQVKNR